MRSRKRIIITALVCIALALLAYFAYLLPFYEFVTNNYDVSFEKLFSAEYLKTLLPLFIIIALAAVGIVLIIRLRRILAKADKNTSRFAHARTERPKAQAPKQKPAPFMVVRWIVMIGFSLVVIFGGLIFGMGVSSLSIPILSCPWNSEEMTSSSCYYLSHLGELFELPVSSILIFFASTLGFIILLGRAICAFLCPMGLVQDIMDKIRRKTKTEGLQMNEKMYGALKPIKWSLVLVFTGLCFAGGNFCNFCPMVATAPILAGISTSLYVSGFIMVFVLIAGFFKRRAFCTICPLGYLMGLFHKASLFRVKKDCTACTECGACYEACPMGIKMIYTEREKTDVTDANCIMCGECVRCCPEDNALSLTFAGARIYTAKRKNVMSGYKPLLLEREAANEHTDLADAKTGTPE
ncbi:MAG: 4Fe-4S binding protein [Ruminococcus sp.]|nr:4Fe-4S binding protein [Ruminococcus sp.]